MSRVPAHARRAGLSVSLLVLAACASAPQSAPPPPPPVSPVEEAIEAAYKPATPEQIAAAERSDPLTRATFWGREYQKNEADLSTTVSFMKALRAISSHDRIDDVAGRALAIHPDSWELYLELGRSKTDQGDTEGAILLFARSADLAPEDEATPLAALGLAFDRIEDHAQAQRAYEMALEREPRRVSTLSNYGLSLALSGQLDAAESALKEASLLPGADIRVRQNLALILGLQGKFDEMEAVSPNAPRRTVEANREALESMLGIGTPSGRAGEAETPETAAPDETPKPRFTLRPKIQPDSAS